MIPMFSVFLCTVHEVSALSLSSRVHLEALLCYQHMAVTDGD